LIVDWLKMRAKSRIASILETPSLNVSSAGIFTFDLSALNLGRVPEFPLPSNVRLGHLAEKVVSELIQFSTNYRLIDENIQVIVDGKTIGEMDFIIEEVATKGLIHMELAYKFYLFDPALSSKLENCWIGPNRKDSLQEKLEKLKEKQFPLLHHEAVQSKLDYLKKGEVSQALCLLATLFIPYGYDGNFSSEYQKAIKGHYLDFEIFLNSDHSGKVYCMPSKKEWGIDPSENDEWSDIDGVIETIRKSMKEKQAPLCWQKTDDDYQAFFIVWWSA